VRAKLWSRIPPLGMTALAAFVVCATTGIMLAPAYKPDAPLDSLALMLLKNPAGAFVRSLHYWSAEAFLVFTLAHIVDHLLRRSETKVQFGVWVRLGLTVPVIAGGMLSGFLLRGDSAALQALQVLRALLGFLPLIGNDLSRLLTGSGPDLFTVYVHHVCTATLLIWLVTIDHSRRIMPTAQAVWWVLPGVLLTSLFLAPSLEWRAASVEKGPWYLVGLQELLHWLPKPQVTLWLALIYLALLVVLPKFPPSFRTGLKWTLSVATLAYALLTIVGLGFRGDNWRLESPQAVLRGETDFLSYKAYALPDATLVGQSVPMIAGRREGCLACHRGMKGFSSAHEPETIGCEACDLGNPFTLNKALAHAAMTRTPGNLTIVDRTCGTSNCHENVAERVRGSLMNTMSGVVGVDRFAFGESHDLNSSFDVATLQHSTTDKHLRTLCASCHLGQNKLEPGPINESSRGGGCSACHLRYDPAAEAELRDQDSASAPMHHPEISVRVPKQACLGCHCRSARIATNYEGWHETQLDETSAKAKSGWPGQFRQSADGRIFKKHSADVHFENGMTCVDCHLAAEVMGDGAAHAHERNAIRISCVDCHAAGETPAKEFAQLDAETQVIVSLRKLNEPGRRFVVTESGLAAYPNVFLDSDGHPLLALEESAKLLKSKPSVGVCARARSIHGRLDCVSCHTAWAPQCIDCHTSFDQNSQSWDYLDGKFINGDWQERSSDYLDDAPSLGVLRVTAPDGRTEDRITTFIPGMILDLELPTGEVKRRNQFRRLFAPASAHTVLAQVRDCRSCHANPLALGYGRGRLSYAVKGDGGHWQFKPEFPSLIQDGLPMDAWIAFLREPAGTTTTRKDACPFTLQEQERILLVGACLECHNEKERRLAAVFADFKNYRAALSPQCRLPDWTFAGSHRHGPSF